MDSKRPQPPRIGSVSTQLPLPSFNLSRGRQPRMSSLRYRDGRSRSPRRHPAVNYERDRHEDDDYSGLCNNQDKGDEIAILPPRTVEDRLPRHRRAWDRYVPRESFSPRRSGAGTRMRGREHDKMEVQLGAESMRERRDHSSRDFTSVPHEAESRKRPSSEVYDSEKRRYAESSSKHLSHSRGERNVIRGSNSAPRERETSGRGSVEPYSSLPRDDSLGKSQQHSLSVRRNDFYRPDAKYIDRAFDPALRKLSTTHHALPGPESRPHGPRRARNRRRELKEVINRRIENQNQNADGTAAQHAESNLVHQGVSNGKGQFLRRSETGPSGSDIESWSHDQSRVAVQHSKEASLGKQINLDAISSQPEKEARADTGDDLGSISHKEIGTEIDGQKSLRDPSYKDAVAQTIWSMGPEESIEWKEERAETQNDENFIPLSEKSLCHDPAAWGEHRYKVSVRQPTVFVDSCDHLDGSHTTSLSTHAAAKDQTPNLNRMSNPKHEAPTASEATAADDNDLVLHFWPVDRSTSASRINQEPAVADITNSREPRVKKHCLHIVYVTLFNNPHDTKHIRDIFPAHGNDLITEINQVMGDDGVSSLRVVKFNGYWALEITTKSDRRYFAYHVAKWLPILKEPPFRLPVRFLLDREVFHTIQVRLPSHIWIVEESEHRYGVLQEIKASNKHLDLVIGPYWVDTNTFAMGFYDEEDIPDSVNIYAPDPDGNTTLQHLREFQYFPPR